MNRIRTAVVGVGHMGKEHARIYSQLEESEFVGVYDISPEVSRSVAQHYNKRSFGSLDELIASSDAISIATPTGSHFEVALRCLEKGKHLLIEKPVAENTQQATELVHRAERAQVVLQVGHVERFNPALEALEKRLTHPRFIEAHRLSPYPGRSTDIGVVMDLMIHDLEIILHLVNSPIASIDAVGVAVLSKGEDIANARLRFENGCIANITTSRISPEKLRKIRVFQEDAYLSLDYQQQQGEIYRKVRSQITREPIPILREEPLKKEIQSFLKCVSTRSEPLVSGRKASDALSVASSIVDAIWSKSPEKMMATV